jgi:hypothetical protein
MPLSTSRTGETHPLGALPSRDAFFFNPYSDLRFTRCPRCEHRTWRRKVPLFIVAAGSGITVEYTQATRVPMRPPGKYH